MPEIVATIGHLLKEDDMYFFDELMNQGVRYFRFNLSKYESMDKLKSRAEFINLIVNKYKSDIRIMLDIPYPGRKPRIYLKENEMPINKNDFLYLTSNYEKSKERNNIIYVDLKYVGNIIKEGAEIIYSDGECEFRVDEIMILLKKYH